MQCLQFAVLAAVLALAPTVSAAESQAIPAPNLQPGDTWIYDRTIERGTNGFSSQRENLTIERVQSDAMVVGVKADGAPVNYQDHMIGLDWSQRLLVDGRQITAARPFDFPMKVGSTWTADWSDPRIQGQQLSAHFHTVYKVVGWEDVTVPAGSFHALKIEANGVAEAQMAPSATAIAGAAATGTGGTTIAHTERLPARTVHLTNYSELYYAPEVKYFVRTLEEQYNSGNVRTSRESQALLSFKPRQAG